MTPGAPPMAMTRGDAGAAELLVQLDLLLGHVEQAAHVGVVHARRSRGVHHRDVPEVLRRVDHGVAAGDGRLHALLVAGVDEAAGGLAAAVAGGHLTGLLLVEVPDHDLRDVGAQPQLLDGPAAHGARTHDGDLHLPLLRAQTTASLRSSLRDSRGEVQTAIMGARNVAPPPLARTVTVVRYGLDEHDWQALEDEVLELFTALLRVDTTNRQRDRGGAASCRRTSPSNGIASELDGELPDRQSLVARLDGAAAGPHADHDGPPRRRARRRRRVERAAVRRRREGRVRLGRAAPPT